MVYDDYNRTLREDGVVGAVRQTFGHDAAGNACKILIQSEQVRIRRFTPRETERLQAFPDDWTRWGLDEKGNRVEISDAQRYMMMGNAVTVNVVEFIARRLPA